MNGVFFLLKTQLENPQVGNIILVFLIVVCLLIVCYYCFKFIEGLNIDYRVRKPLFKHYYYLFKKDLNSNQKQILTKRFKFYNKLEPKEQIFFRHRLAAFLSKVEFLGKEGLIINDEKKTLIAATAIKLTFGFRNYRIKSIDKVIIYPKQYFSNINKKWHSGEFNRAYKALIFSWEDFEKGYEIEDDNLNLGVHECIHALHFSFLNSRRYNASAALFLDSFQELISYIDANKDVKQKLISSGYFRAYAFENQFEFISVLIENFIETPLEFRTKFPKIYNKVKQMLNFNFAGY